MASEGIFKNLTGYFLYLLLVATIGPLLFGFHLSELNAPENVIRCKTDSLDAASGPSLPQCMPMDSTQWGVVGSMFTLGGFMGALAGGPLTSRYGRIRPLQLASIFLAVGAALEALAPNVALFAIGRVIAGIGAGQAMVIVPLYISEIAPPEEKGFFGAFTQVMTNVGILITQLLGFFLSKGQLWRVILAVGGLFGVIQFFGLFLSVDSPKWMADEGQPGKAKKALRKIRGQNFNIDEEVTGWGTQDSDDASDEEQNLLHNEDRMSHRSNQPIGENAKREMVGFFEVIKHPRHSKAVLAVIVVMAAQQFTGINSIIMYGVGLLSSLLSSNSALLNLIVSAVNIFVTAGCAPLVDKLGRKTCLLMSTAVMGVSASLLGIGIQGSIGVLSAISVITFVAGFALGLGPVPFILSSELVDAEAVGATQGWALAMNWVATFIVAMFFPIVNDKLGGKVYFIFTAVAAIAWLFIAKFVPESKGKRTADEVWGRDKRPVD